MIQHASVLPTIRTAADLLEHLGSIPPERVLMYPFPGTATEQDVIDIRNRERRLCELVDGVLVEKNMGYFESRLAIVLGYFFEDFFCTNDLGIVLGADGTVRLAPGLVRIPDVAFFSWRKFPRRRLPRQPIPDLVPDLAVEVLSEGNTAAEMDRKLQEYFSAGVRLVWFIDPETQSAQVYTTPHKFKEISADQALEGGKVLPGFRLLLRDLFTRAGQRQSD